MKHTPSACDSGVCAHGNLKVHHLVREGRYCIVEAEPVLANVVRREDEIALPLLLAFHDDALFALLLARAID